MLSHSLKPFRKRVFDISKYESNLIISSSKNMTSSNINNTVNTDYEQVSNVIIGGGALGASMLYHLTKIGGMSDTILLEKTNLTCGSTWHAAGLVTYYHGGSGLRKIHNYSCNLYPELEKETGVDVSFQRPGSIRLIENDQNRIDETYFQMSKSKLYDTENSKQQLITPSEIKALHPFIELENNDTTIWGGIYTQDDGHIDPTGLTNAFVKGGKMYGGKVHEKTLVNKLENRPDGKWYVYTDTGKKYLCDRIINCAGLWAEHIGKLAGVYHPLAYIEHQYAITETINEVNDYWKKNNGIQLPVLRSLHGSYYVRQERDGLLVGPYEGIKEMRLVDSWNTYNSDGTPLDFGTQLFESDLERIEDNLIHCAGLLPIFGNVGIRAVINGPVSWPPDGNPLLGPIYNDKVKNYWAACGMSYGIAHAGGAAKYLTDWIMSGYSPYELFECDPERYGAWATKQYTCHKVRETYGMNNAITYQKEERLLGRPVRTNSLYYLFKHHKGCQFGFHNGIEQPLYFNNFDNEYKPSYRKTNWYENIKNEISTVTSSCGVMDMSTFSKIIIEGEDSYTLLDKLVANRVPKIDNKIVIGHMLNEEGKIMSELTISKISDNKYYIVTGSDMERHDLRIFYQCIDELNLKNVSVKSITNDYAVLSIAGPNSDLLLSKLVYGKDLSDYKFFTHRLLNLGTEKYGSVPNVNTLKLSFTGLNGYEFHLPGEYLYTLYDNIINVAKDENIKICDFGAYALDSMRMEIGFKVLGTDMRKDDSAVEANLRKFIKLKNRDFIGKNAIEKELNDSKLVKRFLVKISIDSNNCDAFGDNTIINSKTNEVVGWTTSGAYSFQSDKSLAFAYLYNGFHDNNNIPLYVELIGEQKPIKVILEDEQKLKES